MHTFITNNQVLIAFIKDIITIVSLIIAAIVAIKGLRSWEKQLKGSEIYNLSKRVLKIVFRLREAVNHARDPVWSLGEMQSAIQEMNLKVKKIHFDLTPIQQEAIYSFRWKDVASALQDLEVEAVEIEALLGKSAREPFLSLMQSVEMLYRANEVFIRYLYDSDNDVEKLKNKKGFDHFYETVFMNHDNPKDDKFNEEFSSKIQVIENLMRSYLIK